jgi:hypothetical protein
MKTGTPSELSLRARIARAVEVGQNVRGEVSRSIVEAAHAGLEGARGLEGSVSAIARGAIEGARAAVRGGRQPDLAAVVDGVGDGLEKAALAVRLTAEEATHAGLRQAHDDAARMAQAFEHAGRRFVIALGRGLAQAGDDVAARATDARAHLVLLRERLAPVFADVVGALAQRPAAVAGAAVEAVEGALRGAGREARSAVGSAFVGLGKKISGPHGDD